MNKVYLVLSKKQHKPLRAWVDDDKPYGFELQTNTKPGITMYLSTIPVLHDTTMRYEIYYKVINRKEYHVSIWRVSNTNVVDAFKCEVIELQI